MDIKTIIYEINGRDLIIDIENNTVFYENTNRRISDEVLFNYLSRFFSIINNWEEEYIDNSIIDGNVWKLVIIYTDGNQKQYRGKAKWYISRCWSISKSNMRGGSWCRKMKMSDWPAECEGIWDGKGN